MDIATIVLAMLPCWHGCFAALAQKLFAISSAMHMAHRSGIMMIIQLK
jgi:hypothetical protein